MTTYGPPTPCSECHRRIQSHATAYTRGAGALAYCDRCLAELPALAAMPWRVMSEAERAAAGEPMAVPAGEVVPWGNMRTEFQEGAKRAGVSPVMMGGHNKWAPSPEARERAAARKRAKRAEKKAEQPARSGGAETMAEAE